MSLRFLRASPEVSPSPGDRLRLALRQILAYHTVEIIVPEAPDYPPARILDTIQTIAALTWWRLTPARRMGNIDHPLIGRHIHVSVCLPKSKAMALRGLKPFGQLR